MSSRQQLIAALLLILLVLVAAAAQHWLGAKAELVEVERLAPVAEAVCDLQQQACSARFSDGREVVLAITPRPVVVLQPLTVKATLVGRPADEAVIDFKGLEMNMGENRFALQAGEGSTYQGEAQLPICVRNRMAWQAELLLRNGDEVVVAPFQFTTYSAGGGQ
ncbi:MAG: hypothetical protein HQL49_00735 [Gammaproteobacteria bacterium]|nr:hypothetical protein [Gammaproteobacteria bacterium]